ncbi:MAG: apolipoprotein N-acyltransferase [Steroidobacteraceae bacterium]
MFRSTARWPGRVVALVAGVALAGAFAPLSWWWLAPLAVGVLLRLWRDAPSPREAAWLGFLFQAGTFTVGTWWLYVSIHGFGQAPVWIALLLMAALVAIMSGYQAGVGWAIARWLPRSGPLGLLVAMPAAWLLVEWWRGWFLSGFPWLSLGYALSETPLAGLAPIGGVYGLIAVVLLMGGALVLLEQRSVVARVAAIAMLVLPWPIGLATTRVEWTHEDGPPVRVALLQGAVPQDMKWLESNADNILSLYAGLHEQALGEDLVVWPESALPQVANDLTDYIGGIWSSARKANTDVLMGVMRVEDDGVTVHNSLMGLAREDLPEFYDKHHLVPFGEYFPVPDFVRNWARLMSLPYSDFDAGPQVQPPLKAAGTTLSASICYEDAYGSAQLETVRHSELLVNVTNDAWFGRSSARGLHFEIARMRAIESRRFMLRAANDGITAVIDPRGRVVAQAPEFEPAVLRATVQPRSGDTPYLRFGNWPVLGLAALALLAVVGQRRWRARPVAGNFVNGV